MKKLSPSKDDEAKLSRIFGLLPVSTINKNTIQITTHEPLNSSIQKTSITINSDAFPSTVNVNDHVKTYHSSVLITNKLDGIDDRDSQDGLEKSRDKNSVIVCHDKDNETSNFEVVSINMEKTKTLICLDYEKTSQSDEIFPEIILSSEPTTKNEKSERLKYFADSFILKLLNDPYLSHLLYGLEMKNIANIIENSLVRLRTKDTDKLFITSLHDIIKEERSKYDVSNTVFMTNDSNMSNSSCCSQNEISDNINIKQMYSAFDCYRKIPVQKLCEILVDAQNHHQYESINCDPIYEEIDEINEKPPPLPTNPPPTSNSSSEKHYKPMFSGATKHDILRFLGLSFF